MNIVASRRCANLLHRFAARDVLVQGFLIANTPRVKKMNYDWSFFLVIAVAIVAVMLLDLVRRTGGAGLDTCSLSFAQ